MAATPRDIYKPHAGPSILLTADHQPGYLRGTHP
jgi:hypothetical protein